MTARAVRAVLRRPCRGGERSGKPLRRAAPVGGRRAGCPRSASVRAQRARGACAWLALAGAVAAEVSATLSLRAALTHPGLYVIVGAGYAVAFMLLSLALRSGMPLGVAYGIWGALGVALTSVLSALIFGESMSVLTGLGIVLIMAGVLLVEAGAQSAAPRRERDEEAP